MSDLARMKELIDILNEASYAYYQGEREIMTNFEYDALYDELLELEKKTGTILSKSPTQKVGYEVVSSLPKVRHQSPMKSLDKTKDIEALAAFLGDHKGMFSWKLDGLTIVLTYEGGVLTQAATRGNGEIGEVITPNARFFKGVPGKIPYEGHLVVRGEALISYEEFEKINASLPAGEQYKNPRNLCSGSVRQLDSHIAAQRNVEVVTYTLVESDLPEEMFHDSKEQQLLYLASQGFTPVEYRMVTGEKVAEAEKAFAESIPSMPFPVDGLVLTMDSLSESRAAGFTAKFPRDSMAFKWQDENALTTLIDVEWSTSRTGLINPVAIFEPVELEGTTVQRASLHNVSYLREMKLGIGDQIKVYKANMIIPQISENLTQSGPMDVPEFCPRCGGKTEVVDHDGVQELICTEPSCPAKIIRALEHYVSRSAMNIDGLSTATIERLVENGWLDSFSDLYRLEEHKEEIAALEGYGRRSCEKLMAAIEESKQRELYRLLSAIGIPGIGTANARVLADAAHQDIEVLLSKDAAWYAALDGIGEIMAESITRFFANETNMAELRKILSYVTILQEQEKEEGAVDLTGLTFVVTGSLEHFDNRDALKETLIGLGAKVAGSVSKNTNYLINNDSESGSSKNKKAKELGVAIITEEELLQMIGR